MDNKISGGNKPNGIINSAAKLDPKNEITSAPEEKLIPQSNKDGLPSHDTHSNAMAPRINRKTNGEAKNEFPKPLSRVNETPKPVPKIQDKPKIENVPAADQPFGVLMSAAPKKKKMMPVLILIGILFFAAASAAALYVLNPGGILKKRESPQDIIKSSMEAMRNVKTYSTAGNVNFKMDMSQEKAGSVRYDVNIDMNGKADMNDQNNVKNEANMKVGLEMKADSGSEDYSAELEAKSFGTNEFYYKINDFDLGVLGMIMGPQLNEYKGKWFVMNTEDMKKLPGYTEDDSLLYENYNVNKIMEIMSKYEIFKFKKDLGDANVGNTKAYHYQTSLDGMAAVYMYFDMMKEMTSGYKGSDAKELADNLAKAKTDIEQNYKSLIEEGFQNVDAEMWIGKEDRFVYRMTIDGNLSEQYISKVMNAVFGSAQMKAQDAQTKSEVAQVGVDLEIYFDGNNNSYENYKLPAYSDLKPENVRASKDAYMIVADLASVEDKWCLDSTGKSGYVLGNVSGYSCPNASSVPLGGKKEPKASENGDQDLKGSLTFTTDISYNDFNKPVTIEKPEGAVNLLEQMKKSTNSSLSGSGGKTMDSDNDELPDYMEGYYGADPKNSDTDGDGYLDGAEVKNGFDPIKPGSAKLEYGSF